MCVATISLLQTVCMDVHGSVFVKITSDQWLLQFQSSLNW